MIKNKKLVIRLFLALVVLALLIPCGILLRNTILGSGECEAELYFMYANGKMRATYREIPIGSQAEMVEQVLLELQQGAKSDGIQPTIPEAVTINSVEIVDGVAKLDFSSPYYSMENVEEVICRSSIVWSLTSLEFIEGVEIQVESRPLYSKTLEPYGVMNRQNVLIDGEVSATTTEYAILKLYFSNADASDLIVENRVVEVNANQPRERTVMEQLIAGPRDDGNYATIPTETRIKDITTTADGICYVNLSQDFVTRHNGGSTGELLTIYSIVNSLCELDNVERVQFLIEGEKLEVFKGHVDFSTPFVAVQSLKTVDISKSEQK